jgi:hypothetical protein
MSRKSREEPNRFLVITTIGAIAALLILVALVVCFINNTTLGVIALLAVICVAVIPSLCIKFALHIRSRDV